MSTMEKLEELKNVLYVDRIYASLQLLRARETELPEQRFDLRVSELRLFSQNGEDGVIDAILRVINPAERFFVEFGVGDGWSCNCRLLAEIFGWNGWFMEANENDFLRLDERYRFSKAVNCSNEYVHCENINKLFTEYNVPKQFGVLSIDIDGQDYWVWEALDSDYQPEIVVIEFNSALEPEEGRVEKKGIRPDYPLGRCWGASLGAMRALGKAKGYQLVHIDLAAVNLFFIRTEILEQSGSMINGVTQGRSPNFGLRGKDHPPDVLYPDGKLEERPQVVVPSFTGKD